MHEKLINMTKTEKHHTNISVVPLRDRNKFNEKFPDEIINVGPIAKTPTFSTLCVDPISRKMEEHKILSASDIEAKRLRRHTWTLGFKTLDLDDSNIFQGLNLERRRSSASSAQDVIEELPDEEVEEDASTSFDYMKCKNCSQDGGKVYPKDIQLDDINYCFNCKHLYQNKSLFGPALAFDPGRRSSWAPGDKIKKELCRQSSSRGSIDLPSISEPTIDEALTTVDDNEELAMQKRVQNEVDKLIKFKSNAIERRKTIGCEKDYKKLAFLKKFKASRSDSEPSKNNGGRGVGLIRTNAVSSMKKHFLFQ